jgi:hypothetical protein
MRLYRRLTFVAQPRDRQGLLSGLPAGRPPRRSPRLARRPLAATVVLDADVALLQSARPQVQDPDMRRRSLGALVDAEVEPTDREGRPVSIPITPPTPRPGRRAVASCVAVFIAVWWPARSARLRDAFRPRLLAPEPATRHATPVAT